MNVPLREEKVNLYVTEDKLHHAANLLSCVGSEVSVGNHLQEHDCCSLLPLHCAGGALQWRISSHQLCELDRKYMYMCMWFLCTCTLYI